MWDAIRRHWQGVAVIVALVAAPVVAHEEAQETAAEIAEKASKREVGRAAAIIYEGNIAACERENSYAKKLNLRAVNCQDYVPVPYNVNLEEGKAVASGD